VVGHRRRPWVSAWSRISLASATVFVQIVAGLAGNVGEEGEGGDELVIVGLPEQLAEGDAAADDLSPYGVDEGAVAGSEYGVAQERFSFGPVADGASGFIIEPMIGASAGRSEPGIKRRCRELVECTG
jgi:hypothetical protein